MLMMMFYVQHFSKIFSFTGECEKDGTVRQATDGNMIGRMRIAFCITKLQARSYNI
jgi:hypothetical protein